MTNDPIAEQVAADDRLRAMRCDSPDALRTMRRSHEQAKWSWVTSAAEWFRTFARVTALPAFFITLAGFLYYPRPWGSHWSTRKIIAVEFTNFGGIVCLVSILFCFAAWGLNERSASARRRPLWPAAFQNLISLAMFLTTPSF